MSKNICEACGEPIVGKFHSLILREDGLVKVLNGHEECLETYKNTLLSKKTKVLRADTDGEVEMIVDPNRVCKPLSPNAEELTGNYPNKPRISNRVIDDWEWGEGGLMCRLISPNAKKFFKNYPHYRGGSYEK